MRDGFAGVRTLVHDEAEAVREMEFFRDGAGDEEEMAEDCLIVGRGFADARYHLFGDDQEMDGRLWLDVVEDDAVFILVLELGGDFARDDFFEEGFGHGGGRLPTKHTKGTKR